MKRMILICLLLAALLAGCGVPQADVPDTTPETLPVAQTEPDPGWYEPGSSLEQQTNGALRLYLLDLDYCAAAEVMGEGILLFSEQEETTRRSRRLPRGEFRTQEGGDHPQQRPGCHHQAPPDGETTRGTSGADGHHDGEEGEAQDPGQGGGEQDGMGEVGGGPDGDADGVEGAARADADALERGGGD